MPEQLITLRKSTVDIIVKALGGGSLGNGYAAMKNIEHDLQTLNKQTADPATVPLSERIPHNGEQD